MKNLDFDLRSSAPAALLAGEEIRKYLLMMDKNIRFAYGTGGLRLEVDPGIAPVADPGLDDAVFPADFAGLPFGFVGGDTGCEVV